MIGTLSGILVGEWAMTRVLGVLVAALVAWGSAAQADEHGRWQQLENNPSCSVWNAYPKPSETVTWSGSCGNEKAQGRGSQVWRYLEDEDWKESKYTGEMKDGKRTGRGVYVRRTATDTTATGRTTNSTGAGFMCGRAAANMRAILETARSTDAVFT